MQQLTSHHRCAGFALAAAALLAVAAGTTCSAAQIASQVPNVVVLFIDDGGYGDLTCYGHPTIRTPHLDQMAAEGMRFTQFYSASPACSASRYSLLTGRLPIRSGFAWVLMPDTEKGIAPEETTLAEGLRESGYATACIGKWHLGATPAHLPLQNGFDEFFGLPYSNDMQPPRFPPLPLMRGNDAIAYDPDQSTLTAEYTKRAIEFINKNKTRPFFCYVPYSMPHIPLNPGKAFRGVSRRGAYGDAIEEIDWSVGQILNEIRDQGLSENTLVLFASDNGPWVIKGSRGGSAGLLRDGKGSTWEGGVRVPCIAWWPNSVPAGTVSRQVASTMDVLPTLYSLAGKSPPQSDRVDGVDLSGVLLGKQSLVSRPPLFFYGARNKLYAVRYGVWKLHIKEYSQTGKTYFSGKPHLLFNVEQDPSEQYDLSSTHPGIVERLLSLIEAHKKGRESHVSLSLKTPPNGQE